MNIAKLAPLQKRSVRIWCAVAVIVLLFAATVYCVWTASRNMFSGNERYTLSEVRVIGNKNGYWSGRAEELCTMLGLRIGTVNLFNLDPKAMRRKLRQEPNIADACVRRILPDTVVLEITERIPIARIKSRRLNYVVDSSGILMQQDRCMNIAGSLPLIIGFRNEENFVPGMKAAALKGALELIEQTRVRWSSLRIASVDVTRRGVLVCAVLYTSAAGTGRMYYVTMPDTDIPGHLSHLMQVLEQMRSTRNPSQHINLLFKGQAVLTSPVG